MFDTTKPSGLWSNLKTEIDSSVLGQLAFKEEAAGKVRVFAMVDVWTQSALKPLHDWLFATFRNFPNDSTHDQSAGFLRAQQKSVEYGKAFCYDLSAATDRLPIDLQISILNSLLGDIPNDNPSIPMSYGQAWANLLCKREYHLPLNHPLTKGLLITKVRYATGQPMGAYSS